MLAVYMWGDVALKAGYYLQKQKEETKSDVFPRTVSLLFISD